MYETHFGFHRPPFQSADACRAFFVSDSIRTILPQLLHAVRSDLGIAVLTGVPGCGKTALLRHLQQLLSSEGRAIVCSGANLGTSGDLIDLMVQASRMTAGSESTARTFAAEPRLQGTRASALEHMKRTAELWGPILLLIDDTQLVPPAVLNELRACTEVEWNGRDLVRCLVSAPISFEEQLARPEYAEFCRRIRCHAFLQPLKSVESIRFLQEQIELAGGRLPFVFTTSALELIVAAADGIPRCLCLLADEALVVAAETSEKIATEQSVRTALSRLQHLQYNWNASPHAEIADESLFESGGSSAAVPSITEPSRLVSSNAAVVSKRSPERAIIAPGVIEFGGPETPSVANVSPEVESPTQSVVAINSQAIDVPVKAFDDVFSDTAAPIKSESNVESEAPFDTETLAGVKTDAADNKVAAIESGVSQNAVGIVRSAGESISAEPQATFEVGRRFFSESTEESICIEDVEDSVVLDLLNLDRESEFMNPECPDGTRGSVDSGSVMPRTFAQGLEWIEGKDNKTHTEFSSANDLSIAPAADNASANGLTTSSGLLMSEDESLIAEQSSQDLVSDKPFLFISKLMADSGFLDPGDSRVLTGTPVFDRYTWLALGRDVPPGTGSVVSPTKGQQAMLAACEMSAQRPRAGICAVTDQSTRSSSIARISITRTTDLELIEEIARHSSSGESGSFVAFRNQLHSDHKVPDQELPYTSRVPASVAERPLGINPSDESLPVDACDPEAETPSALGTDSRLSGRDDMPTAVHGLKIWQNGQLVFAESGEKGISDAGEANVSHTASNVNAVDEAAYGQVISQPEIVSQPGVGEFFTLPVPVERIDLDLRSPAIAEDHEFIPLVEALTDLSLDMQYFHQTGRALGELSEDLEHQLAAADLLDEPDSLISRAKRRLDDSNSVTDSTVVALQMTSEARIPGTAVAPTASDPESTSAMAGGPGSGPQFSRLFTRLWENRERGAGQAKTES